MAMSYTVLTGAKSVEGSIKYYVRHSEVPSASILESAQALIYSLLRVREMKTLVTSSFATDATTITLPTGFLEPISLWLDRNNKAKIRILDEEHFEQRVGRDANGVLFVGAPTFCTMDKTLIYLDAKADQTYYYRLWYYGTPAALSGGNETNFLTTRYPHLLEAACKHYAYAHREDDGAASKWLQVATAAIEKANGEHDMFQQAIQHELYWDQ